MISNRSDSSHIWNRRSSVVFVWVRVHVSAQPISGSRIIFCRIVSTKSQLQCSNVGDGHRAHQTAREPVKSCTKNNSMTRARNSRMWGTSWQTLINCCPVPNKSNWSEFCLDWNILQNNRANTFLPPRSKSHPSMHKTNPNLCVLELLVWRTPCFGQNMGQKTHLIHGWIR